MEINDYNQMLAFLHKNRDEARKEYELSYSKDDKTEPASKETFRLYMIYWNLMLSSKHLEDSMKCQEEKV